jgi:hypothetical protein
LIDARLSRPSTTLGSRTPQNSLSFYPREFSPFPFDDSFPTFTFIRVFLPISQRARARTSAPSSHSIPSSPKALRLRPLEVESRRATSTARTPPRRPLSSPSWPFSDLGTLSITRVRDPSLSLISIAYSLISRLHYRRHFLSLLIAVHLSTFVRLCRRTMDLTPPPFFFFSCDAQTEHHKNHPH